MSTAGQALDRALGRDLGEPVTVDLDATQVTVYGREAGRGALPDRAAELRAAHRVLGAARPGAVR